MRTATPLILLLALAACNKPKADAPRASADQVVPKVFPAGSNGGHAVARPADPLAALHQAFDSGLRYTSDDKGFLRQVLAVAGVDERSQVLVFSKTSHQLSLIDHDRPRAIYFSDDCYIGMCQNGLYELSQPSAKQGTELYALDFRTRPMERPVWDSPPRCLDCHEGAMTGGRVGLMVRSVFTGADSQPITSAGTRLVDHTTPIAERWGGWFVTGRSGSIHHQGNQVAVRQADGSALQDKAAGSNVESLTGRIDTTNYLRPGSDIVALMVLEHQIMAHNVLTQTSQAIMEYFQKYGGITAPTPEADAIMREERAKFIRRQAQKVVEVLLFKDEAAMPEGGVEGDPEFQSGFRANRHAAKDGGSLKDFQLLTHLFKYRCSYMVYSKAFNEMTDVLKAEVWQVLKDALTTDAAVSQHIPWEEKEDIQRILRETHPGLPAGW